MRNPPIYGGVDSLPGDIAIHCKPLSAGGYVVLEMSATDTSNRKVGEVTFLWHKDKNELTIFQQVNVSSGYRRRKIATRMYVEAERVTGATAVRDPNQTENSKALWAQPNRPFGNKT
jgi:hypothetical protein